MKVVLLLILFPFFAYAGPYYENVISTTAGTSTMTISGYIGVAASSTTPTTYKFRLDGPGGYLQFPDATKQTTAFSSSTADNYALLNATQTFTGQNTFIATSTTTFGYMDIGFESIISSGTGANEFNPVCSAGKKLLFCQTFSGAGTAVYMLHAGPQNGTSTTTCDCYWTALNVNGLWCIANCARIK